MNNQSSKDPGEEKISLYKRQYRKMIDASEMAARLTSAAHNQLVEVIGIQPALLPHEVSERMKATLTIQVAAVQETKTAIVRAAICDALLNKP